MLREHRYNMPVVVSSTVQLHIAIPGDFPGEWQFLLLKRSAAVRRYPGIMQTITGGIEEGETALQAAFREAQEEIGIVPDSLWVLPFVGSFYEAESDTVQLCAAFGGIISTDAVQLSTEHSAYAWLPLEDAIQQLAMPSHQEGTRTFYRDILSVLPASIPFPHYSFSTVACKGELGDHRGNHQ